MVKVLKCPNCQESYDANSTCEFCGSNFTMNNQSILAEKRYFKKLLLNEDEQPIRLGVANLYYGVTSSDGGKLYLTDQRLVFIAHKANLNPNLYWEIALQDIQDVTIKRNLIVSQHILVKTNKEEDKMFVVYNGKKWINEILKAKSQ